MKTRCLLDAQSHLHDDQWDETDRARSQAGAESGMKIWRAEQAKKKKLRTKFKKGIDAVMAAHKLGLKSATQSPVVDRWDLRTLNLDRSIGE